MSKKRSLGRGLDALLGASATASEAAEASESTVSEVAAAPDKLLKELPIDLIQRGKYQPRRDMVPESLQELADSIKAQGVMQPIVVRPISDRKYEIIAGERRWRATQLAGLDTIPAVIRDVPDEAAIAMALIENIQREDLNPYRGSCLHCSACNKSLSLPSRRRQMPWVNHDPPWPICCV